MTKPKIYTAKELGKILNLNPQTIYRLGREGKIPTCRITNGTVRFYMPERTKHYEQTEQDCGYGA